MSYKPQDSGQLIMTHTHKTTSSICMLHFVSSALQRQAHGI